MLVSITKLNISNTGYERPAKLEKIFINTERIISIVNYEKIKDFLIREGNDLSDNSFSLMKISSGKQSEEDLIVLGSPEQIVSSFRVESSTEKEVILG
mgnify:CR=1 FL=1